MPPGTPTVATAWSPLRENSKRDEAGDVLGDALVAVGLQPRRDAGARRRLDAVAPLAQRLRGLDRAADLALGLLVAQRRVGLRPAVRHQQVLLAGQQ